MADGLTCLDAIDAIYTYLVALIAALNRDGATFALYQYGISWDVSHSVGDSFRLGRLVNPTKGSSSYIAVVVAGFGGIDTDVVGGSEGDGCVVVLLDVCIRYVCYELGSFCFAAKSLFAVLVADRRF